MQQALTDIEQMLHHKHNGKIISPIRTMIEFPEENGSVLYMPNTDLDEKIISMKTVTIFPKQLF